MERVSSFGSQATAIAAIVAVVTALLCPVFGKAGGRSVQDDCFTNMRYLARGIGLYANDYDQTYPLSATDASADGSYAVSAYVFTWKHAIFPYVAISAYYQCPRAATSVAQRSCFRPPIGLGTGPRWISTGSHAARTRGNTLAMGTARSPRAGSSLAATC